MPIHDLLKNSYPRDGVVLIDHQIASRTTAMPTIIRLGLSHSGPPVYAGDKSWVLALRLSCVCKSHSPHPQWWPITRFVRSSRSWPFISGINGAVYQTIHRF